MGTRGFIAFAVDGRLKVAYNHAASEPQTLGREVLWWLHRADLKQVRESARALAVVDGATEPLGSDISRLCRFYEPVAGGSPWPDYPSWYQLLRGTMGNPQLILEAGVIEDASDWPADPQAAWGYVVDFDASVLEVYVGYQRQPHSAGRFAHRGVPDWARGRCYPARLLATWPLEELPGEDEFLGGCDDSLEPSQ